MIDAMRGIVRAANPQTAAWGYEGTGPGPELRFSQGERIWVEIENQLPPMDARASSGTILDVTIANGEEKQQ